MRLLKTTRPRFWVRNNSWLFLIQNTANLNPIWGDIFERSFKAQSSRLKSLLNFEGFSLKSWCGTRDVRALSFELWNSIRECHHNLKWHRLYKFPCSSSFSVLWLPASAAVDNVCKGVQNIQNFRWNCTESSRVFESACLCCRPSIASKSGLSPPERTGLNNFSPWSDVKRPQPPLLVFCFWLGRSFLGFFSQWGKQTYYRPAKG